MKRIYFAMVAIMITFIGVHYTTVAQEHDHKKHQMKTTQLQGQAKEVYACPMHPEVTSNKPGKCQKCGMNLEKKSMKKKEMKSEIRTNLYACPMHPEEKSDKSGKCSKCGMNLEKKIKH